MAKYKLRIGPLTFGNLQEAFVRDLAVSDLWQGAPGPDPIVILERFCTGISAVLRAGEDEVAVEVVWSWGRVAWWELQDYATGEIKIALI